MNKQRQNQQAVADQHFERGDRVRMRDEHGGGTVERVSPEGVPTIAFDDGTTYNPPAADVVKLDSAHDRAMQDQPQIRRSIAELADHLQREPDHRNAPAMRAERARLQGYLLHDGDTLLADVTTANGCHLRMVERTDDDGDPFVELVPLDGCSLDGEMPGQYYVLPEDPDLRTYANTATGDPEPPRCDCSPFAVATRGHECGQ